MLRPVRLPLIAAFIPLILSARSRTSGYCEQGGQPVVTSAVNSTTKVQQSYPQCSITVYYTGGSGTVSTSGSTVTLISGNLFGGWAGITIAINSVNYVVAFVTDSSHLTLTTNIGTNASVPYQTQSPALAPIYADNAGTPLANPFSASATGYWGFFANNGTYDVKLSGGGIASPFTWTAISVFDPLSAPTFTGTSLGVLVTAAPYNAVCNGTGDQSGAINTAISAVGSAGGGTVGFPAGGNCRITSPLIARSNVALWASGATITQATANLEAVDVGGTTGVTITGLTFSGGGIFSAGFTPTSNLTITGNTITGLTTVTYPYYVGIYSAIGLSNALIQNNRVVNVGQGMIFGTVAHLKADGNFCSGTLISDCIFLQNSASAIGDAAASSDITITNNTFDNLWKMGVELQGGFYQDSVRILHNTCSSWNGAAPVGLSFCISASAGGVGMTIDSNTGTGTGAVSGSAIGVEALGPAGTVVSNNEMRAFQNGMTIDNGCANCEAVHNRFISDGIGINAINHASETNLAIKDNVIDEPAGIGIYLQDGAGCRGQISGNVINRTPLSGDSGTWVGIGLGTCSAERTLRDNRITLLHGTFPGSGGYNLIQVNSAVAGTLFDGNRLMSVDTPTVAVSGILLNSVSTELNGSSVNNSIFDNLTAASNAPTSSTVAFLGNTGVNGTPAHFITAYTPNISSGAANPATCHTGDIFFNTAAMAGSNVFGCTATNTWTLQ